MEWMDVLESGLAGVGWMRMMSISAGGRVSVLFSLSLTKPLFTDLPNHPYYILTHIHSQI
jgi:hypothetical protein